jgi:hypothetical protein
MAQDDRKGHRPGSSGKAADSLATDAPSTRDINAEPAPERPATQPTDARPPAAAADGNKGSKAAGAAPKTPEQDSDENPPGDETDDLEEAVEAAKKALKEKEEELARYKEQREADKAAAKLVDDYAAEEDALKLANHDFEQYQLAETSFLSQFLDSATMTKISEAAKTAQAEIDALAAKIGGQEATAAAKRKARDAARDKAAEARRKAEALQRPAASIRDRLKAADAIRSEAKKASDDGKYALAYWLVMPDGKLDQAIKGEPRILDHDDLRKQVKTAHKAQEDAEQALAKREEELKKAEDVLRDEQVRLVELRRKFDATVLENVAALNPTIVKAA